LRISVIGDGNFIASEFALYLFDQEDEVVVIDSHNDCYSLALKEM